MVFRIGLVVLGLWLAGGTLVAMVFRNPGGLTPRQMRVAIWRGRWRPWTIGCMSSGLTMVVVGLLLKRLQGLLLDPDNMAVFHQALLTGVLLAGGTLLAKGFHSTNGKFWRCSQEQQAEIWRGRWRPWTIGCMSTGLTMVAIGLILKGFT